MLQTCSGVSVKNIFGKKVVFSRTAGFVMQKNKLTE